MTSRFGKTYSRKAGDSGSKFDEVLSTKRGTLSTKWGDTTYKAKVGSKRGCGPKHEACPDVFKRPRTGGGGGGEDPFGFDSDEESKPVTSRVKTPEKSERQTAYAPVEAVGTSSWDSIIGMSHTTATTAGSKRETWTERDRANSSSSATLGHPVLFPPSEPQLTYSWYQNASESDRKPLAQTTTLKTLSKPDPVSSSSSVLDQWDAIVGLRPPSPSANQEPRNPAPSLWASTGYEKTPSPPPQNHEFTAENPDYSDYSDYSSTLVRNTVCRTYRRPIKSKDSSDAVFDALKSSESESQSVPAAARGRTRDFTVLHPSSMSACNVTIQERTTDAAPSTGGSGQSGEAAWRKKTEHNSRFGPSQKKESMSDLFGFEEDPGLDLNSSEPSDGPSNYKIKYFGFDDMSDSDGEEGGARERRKTKRKMRPNLEEEETPEEPCEDIEDPFDRFDRLERMDRLQMNERTTERTREKPVLTENKKNSYENRLQSDVLDFSEEGLRIVAGAPRRAAAPSKTTEKNPDSFRRIFSAQKKSPTKAVYNARHWTMNSEEEPPPAFLSKPQAAPSSGPSSSSSSSVAPSDSQNKDDGVFKAPPPPPKVSKCVRVPSDPCQETVTALRCHKEHKEVRLFGRSSNLCQSPK